jgi:dephospho-CoA kinase
MGNLVFKSITAMLKLTKIMSPLIDKESHHQINYLHNEEHYSIVGYDAALIIENDHADFYRPLIVVSCPRNIQIQRLMKRNSLTEEQAINRIDAQLPLEIKVKYANYIIDTSGSIDDTRAQTFSIIQELLKNNRNT